MTNILGRFGKWYIFLWESKYLGIEIGLGDCSTKGNYGAFFSKQYRFLSFYLVVSKPTLSFLKQRKQL